MIRQPCRICVNGSSVPSRKRLSGLNPAAFLRREDGAMIMFGLFAFIIMILIAGIAVDMMRYENQRIRLQGATDRAALAGTALRSSNVDVSPEDIVRSYLAADGYGDLLGDRITVTEAPEDGRTVSVSPRGNLPTSFMRLAGVDTLPLHSHAAANEAISGGIHEIVLVVDLSDSMSWGSGSRLENLRTAGRDLVTKILSDAAPGSVSLTLVPYSGWVVAPSEFADHFTNTVQGSGACIDFHDFGDVSGGFATPVNKSSHCLSRRPIEPYVRDLTSALAFFDNLTTANATSIDLAVRFGGLFFDPGIRPAINQMILNEGVDPIFAGRPFDWGAPGVARSMVVMTDGRNYGPYGRSVWHETDSRAVMNARTLEACGGLKARDITIYAVAFEAPSEGIEVLTACASSPNHFFQTHGVGLTQAFDGIASHIRTKSLRLIQ